MAENAKKFSDKYTHVINREGYQNLQEFAETVNDKQEN
jgi:hypothetical protein